MNTNDIIMYGPMVVFYFIIFLLGLAIYNIFKSVKTEKTVIKTIRDSINGIPYDSTPLSQKDPYYRVLDKMAMIEQALEKSDKPEAKKALEWFSGIDSKSTMIIYINKILKG